MGNFFENRGFSLPLLDKDRLGLLPILSIKHDCDNQNEKNEGNFSDLKGGIDIDIGGGKEGRPNTKI